MALDPIAQQILIPSKIGLVFLQDSYNLIVNLYHFVEILL